MSKNDHETSYIKDKGRFLAASEALNEQYNHNAGHIQEKRKKQRVEHKELSWAKFAFRLC